MMQLTVFEIPREIEDELIKFYLDSQVFSLEDIKNYRNILEKYQDIYFLYYKGDFPLYARISQQNRRQATKPIYVGKAVSAGGRTGQASLSKNSLYKRLNEHYRSVKAASTTLNTSDFDVRVVAMKHDLISWAEQVMIRRLQPIWNTKLSGFGIHDPGRGRYNQRRSIWDQIHPGRTWAKNMSDLASFDMEELKSHIEASLQIDM